MAGPPGTAAPPKVSRLSASRPHGEIAGRLEAGEPFHLATLLRGAVVGQWPAELARHLALPYQRQAELLREALEAGGARRDVAGAVAAVPRHLLVPEALRPRAYLDEFHATSSGSGLTPQSLVASMLEHLDVAAGARVLELGVGSGFHALAVLGLGAAKVTGVEADGGVLRAARARLRDLPQAARLELLFGAGPTAALGSAPFDRAYATFAYTSPVAALLPLLAEGGLVQVPRPVLRHELEREPLLARERERYGSFERFFESWQHNLCVTTYRREGGSLRVVDKMFGAQFVAQRDEPVASSEGAA